MRFAVVGHIEWIEFIRVERVPRQGELVRARERWCEPAGGGAVAAVQIARLAGSCELFTAVGDDEEGRQAVERLGALGVRVRHVERARPTRRGITFVDDAGERTITVIGEKIAASLDDTLPWWSLQSCDAVYFTGGDAGSLRAARLAGILTATPRELKVLQEAAVELDALIGSAHDPGEAYAAGELTPEPRLVVRTEGAAGGLAEPGGRWQAAPLTGPVVDAYGCGDSFAGALTYGLGSGMTRDAALSLAARCGAEALCRRGAYGSA
jgi:ribokinase